MRRNLSAGLLMLAGALMLSGCGGPSLPPVPQNGVILAFGDSLTAGVGASTGQSYPEVLASLSGRVVINAGISGEETAQGRQRLPQALQEHQPDLLILMEGGNDILRNRSKTELKANLAAMIEQAQGQGVPVMLVGVPERALFSDSAPLYGELAEQYQLVFEPKLLRSLLGQPALKSDPIHFNAGGYQALAEGLYQRLVDAGAL
ncbi:arylesterase [Ferrimonas marina]|nr:arylesterase [Ferrimonas marina]